MKNTIEIGDFNTILSEPSGQKLVKVTEKFNNTVNKVDLINYVVG